MDLVEIVQTAELVIVRISTNETTMYPSLDERIAILANLIVDRILEDKKNGVLKFANDKPNLDIKLVTK